MRQQQPRLLDFDKSMLVAEDAGEGIEEAYPDFWQQGEHRFRLTYQSNRGTRPTG